MPGEVKMATTEWYLAMGEAVRERNRALSMAQNWQEKVTAAEARIDALAAQQHADPAPAPEQV